MPAAAPVAPKKQMGPAPHKARVQFFNEDGTPLDSRTPPAPPDTGEPVEETVMQAGHAIRVFDTLADETEPEPDVQPAATTVAGEPTSEMGEFTKEELNKLGELKIDPESPGARSYINLQRKLGEQGSTITALNTQVQDMLAARTAPAGEAGHEAGTRTAPDVVALQKEIDATMELYHQNILDPSAKTHLKKLNDLQVKLAKAELNRDQLGADNAAMIQATKALMSEYPGLVRNKADAAYIDASVEGMKGGATLENYKKALDGYAKERGWTKPSTSATPNADVDRMRTEAGTQAEPAATGVRPKGKIWKRSELDELLRKYPEKYRNMQKDIMRAYQEGRVDSTR